MGTRLNGITYVLGYLGTATGTVIRLIIEVIWAIYIPIAIHIVVVMRWIPMVVVVLTGGMIRVASPAICPAWVGVSD